MTRLLLALVALAAALALGTVVGRAWSPLVLTLHVHLSAPTPDDVTDAADDTPDAPPLAAARVL